MKQLLIGWMLVMALAHHVPAASGSGHALVVAIEPRFANAPLIFDTLTNTTAAGQQVSVSRLDFLLSNIALRRAEGGAWLGLTNWFAYLSPREGRTSFALNNIPAGRYDRVRFHVGVPAQVNLADPANYPSQHPLNPNVNGLHWNWQGGYVFLAIEGGWRQDKNEQSGYSYHVATDRLLMTVERPLALELAGDRELNLALNVDQIFSGKHRIAVSADSTSTHSREDDALAAQLRDNIQLAFAVSSVRSPGLAIPLASTTNKIDTAAAATPYRLTISQFFPRPALPLDNPLTEEGVRLGALLFFDPRLSVNDSQSCASCHEPAFAFTDGKAVSIGAEGQAGKRSAMPLLNLVWKSSYSWDGRAPSLRAQVLQPIQDPIEMHETLTNAVRKIQSAGVNARHEARSARFINPSATAPTEAQSYSTLFTRAFGTPEVTSDRIARALEQFLLIQVSHASKFDKALRGEATLTEQEKRGFQLFNTEYDPRRQQFGADCFHCHGGPLFQSLSFANNGLDLSPRDLGRFLVTAKEGDRGKFAVPSLRNVAVTSPYMHDGRFTTLEQVVEHYASGVQPSPTLDPNLAKHPRGGVPLNAEDRRAIVAFLNTLTDERFLGASMPSAEPSHRSARAIAGNR